MLPSASSSALILLTIGERGGRVDEVGNIWRVCAARVALAASFVARSRDALLGPFLAAELS